MTVFNTEHRNNEQDKALLKYIKENRSLRLLDIGERFDGRGIEYILERLESLATRGFLSYNTGCDGYVEQVNERWSLTLFGMDYLEAQENDKNERVIRAGEKGREETRSPNSQ